MKNSKHYTNAMILYNNLTLSNIKYQTQKINNHDGIIINVQKS